MVCRPTSVKANLLLARDGPAWPRVLLAQTQDWGQEQQSEIMGLEVEGEVNRAEG